MSTVVIGGPAPTAANPLGLPLHTVTPEQFGAVGNTPGFDDAPAIEQAIWSAVEACLADGTYVACVLFDSGKRYYANRAAVYNPPISSATYPNIAARAGANNKSFAQIALPWLPWTYDPNQTAASGKPVVTLMLMSTAPLSDVTTFIDQPCAIKSTQVTPGGGQSYVANQGCPAVVGSFPRAGTGLPTNTISGIHLVWAGISTVVPVNPPYTALDIGTVVGCQIPTFHAYAPTGTYAPPAAPTNGSAAGIVFPINNNSGTVRVGYAEVVGFKTGYVTAEQLLADELVAYGCGVAVQPQAGSHTNRVGRLNFANNDVDFADIDVTTGAYQYVGTYAPLNTTQTSPIPLFVVHQYEVEVLRGGASATLIYDQNNLLVLDANYGFGGGQALSPVILGGAYVTLRNLKTKPGAVASQFVPAVPSSGTALVNPYFRNIMIAVTGGSGVSVKIDGQTMTGSGPWILPNNRSITLTYTTAPTWQWVVLP